jgi:glutamate-1-semialdehyde aminotransferase
MLDRGVMLAPSAYEVMFVSLAHDAVVIDWTVEVFEDAMKSIT